MSEESKKTKVRLKICGSQFLITADESEQYIQKIAKMVDEQIKYLDNSDPKLSLHMATIVAALNYCDQLEKERVITRELIKKADDCEAIAKDATLRINRLLTENAQLKAEKAGLHKVISELKEGNTTTSTSTPSAINKKPVANPKITPSKLNSINNANSAETVTDEDFFSMLDGENY
ncbi:MAG: cell division protein ZapA [Acutalibacteraceae bacterium]|nr:cell division protein ZapA [Acutalibacteraceae bacterium]